MKRGIEHISNECLRIFFSEEYKQSIGPDVLEIYLIDLINELQDFSIANEPYRTIIENDPRKAIYKTRLDMEEFYREKDKVIWVLEVTLNEITKDSELIDYAKQSINETLSVEFSGQIQPAAQDHVFSAIEM